MKSEYIIKYILIGLITFLAIRYIPSNAINVYENLMVAMCVSIVYAIIDKLLPSYTTSV
jgi:hypothetical protein